MLRLLVHRGAFLLTVAVMVLPASSLAEEEDKSELEEELDELKDAQQERGQGRF